MDGPTDKFVVSGCFQKYEPNMCSKIFYPKQRVCTHLLSVSQGSLISSLEPCGFSKQRE